MTLEVVHGPDDPHNIQRPTLGTRTVDLRGLYLLLAPKVPGSYAPVRAPGQHALRVLPAPHDLGDVRPLGRGQRDHGRRRLRLDQVEQPDDALGEWRSRVGFGG